MKRIAKVGRDGKMDFDRVADEVANKMNIQGNLSKAAVVGSEKLTPGNYYVSKDVWRMTFQVLKKTEVREEQPKEKIKQPKEHRKAKDIRAANQKHKRG